MLGCGAVHDHHIASQGVAPHPVDPRRVAQPDLHPLFGRPGVAKRVQPHRHAGATAGGIHHEVGHQDLLGAAVGPA